jgi:hypothetical protein
MAAMKAAHLSRLRRPHTVKVYMPIKGPKSRLAEEARTHREILGKKPDDSVLEADATSRGVRPTGMRYTLHAVSPGRMSQLAASLAHVVGAAMEVLRDDGVWAVDLV